MMNVLKRTRNVGFLAAAAASVAMLAAGTGPEKAEINKAAPNFTLEDLDGKQHTLADYTAEGKVVVLEWFNPDCPVVRNRYDNYAGEVAPTVALEAEFAGEVVWLRINSGAEGKQGAGKGRNATAVEDFKIASTVLLDESGEVGKAYKARVTPELYVIDAEGMLRYHGAIDSEPMKKAMGEKHFLKDAIQAVLAGETVEVQETRAQGCSVKYGS